MSPKLKGRREPPYKMEAVEMLDGRTYYSDDNWATVYLMVPGYKNREVTGEEASHARYLAFVQK